MPPPELDHLFDALRTASTVEAARAASERIWQVWMHHDEPRVARLMEDGIHALMHEDYETAHAVFDAIVAADPAFAEGWNKRATVRYLTGDYAGAVRDIRRTLALEPRHFGALAGLGSIRMIIADERGALEAFEAVLTLHPQLRSIRKQVQALRRTLDD